MEKNKNEKEENNIDNSCPVEETYNRKNVNRIKACIVFFLAVMCMLSVFMCIQLAGRLADMNKRADRLKVSIKNEEEISEENCAADGEMVSDDEFLALDQAASDDIIKNTTEEGIALSSPVGETEQTGQINHFNGKKVYLTFDDGPSIYTEEILQVLREKGVKATFFVVYTDDEELWDEYSRIVEEGHTLGVHSYTHIYDKVYKDLDSFKNDVTMIHDFLYEQTGVDSTYYRFPGGSSNTVSNVSMQILMKYICDEGYTYYDWNSLSGDAVDAYLSPEQLNDNIMGYVRSNSGDSMVLMHDLKNNHATVEALPALIDTLIEEGYRICPIDENTEPVQHIKYTEE